MAVIGTTEYLSSTILDAHQGFGICAGAAAYPRGSFVPGVVEAFVGAGEDLVPVGKEVPERAAVTAGIAGYPRCAAVGGVLDPVVGEVDSDQLVSKIDK